MRRAWMPHYVGDYLRDTAHLRARESGAYLHLIMAYWLKGSLPDDDRQLATIAKLTDAQWRQARPLLAPFFGANWSSHRRIDVELERAQRVAASTSQRASHAANKRWSKQRNGDAASMPAAMLGDAHPQPPSHPSELRSAGTGVRATRIAADWLPNDDDRNFAVGQGFADDDIARMAANFRDYWIAKSGRDASKIDWPATWRRWVRTETERRGGRHGKPGGAQSRGDDFFAGLAAVAADIDRDGAVAGPAGALSPVGRADAER